VLRPGGDARIMIYHKWSLVGAMLWARCGLLRMRLLSSLAQIYSQHLESPRTQAYMLREGRALFEGFSRVDSSIVLTHGDLLTSSAGQRRQGPLLTLARAVWPKRLLRWLAKNYGLFMLIRAVKSSRPRDARALDTRAESGAAAMAAAAGLNIISAAAALCGW